MKKLTGVLTTSALTFALAFAAAAPTQAAPETGSSIVVAGNANRTFESVWRTLTSRGVDQQYTAKVLKAYREHVGQRHVRLYPVEIVDLIQLSNGMRWEPAKVVGVLVGIQTQIDEGAKDPRLLYREVINAISTETTAEVRRIEGSEPRAGR